VQPPAPSAQGPDEVWLQLHGDDSDPTDPVDFTDGVTWCWHQINDSDVRYVRAAVASTKEPATGSGVASGSQASTSPEVGLDFDKAALMGDWVQRQPDIEQWLPKDDASAAPSGSQEKRNG
jgi:hypothetical protein